MVADERLNKVVALVTALLDAESALLRAAVAEPDDDAYLAAHATVAAFYAPPPGSQPLGPRSSRRAEPGGRSPEATGSPGDNLGASLYGVGRVSGTEAGAEGWVAFTGDGRDADGVSLGLALLVQEVEGALRVTGRADWDPFEDQITFAAAGGLPVPVDGPFADAAVLQLPRISRHAVWLTDRLGPVGA